MVSGGALRVAFFGTPDFAVPTLTTLLQSRHEVVAVISQPDRPKGRGHKLHETPTKAAAAAVGVPVLQPARIRDDAFLGAIRDMHLDLGVVAAYGKILPDSLLALPRLGMINVHASLLPEYRGAAPVHRAVIDGREETGVTIMRVVSELDAGPMLATARHPIGPNDTSPDVEHALAQIGATLLLSVVDRIAEGTATDVPQDHSRATYAPKIVKTEGVIDWSLPGSRIHNLVRGLQPWPLVSAWIEGHRLLIHATERTGDRSSMRGGTVVEAASDRLTIAAGDGEILHVLRLQPEGKRVMSAREFLAGHSIRAGTQLTSA